MKEITDRLFALRDEKFADFLSKLVPNVQRGSIIGVRTPALRGLAKELSKDAGLSRAFFAELPHKYYEENALHGFLLDGVRDYDECVALVNKFLPFVDNWAVCDQTSPKVFKKNTDRLINDIDVWLASDRTYTVRFGIEMLMSYYLDERFDVSYLEKAAAIRSDEYYVNMMTAWYFATALTKQYDAALPFITGRKLDRWTHNKAIQKARESRCIPNDIKEYLNTLKY